MFVDGIARGTITTSYTIPSSGTIISVGAESSTPTYFFKGYISNLRLIKGTGLYNGNFTPPTAPLTATSNTTLLLPFTNAAVYDNTMLSNLETVGNVQANTSVFKYGTGALKFNGTTDYLTIPNNSNFSFGTGDFTIEMWVYASSFSGYRTLIDARGSDSTVSYGLFLETTSGQLYWYDGSATQMSSSGPPLNTWTHIAAVRTSGVLKMFIAGVQVYSAANTNAQNPTGPLLIGKNIGSTAYFNGYIDELRITKGAARYTTAFTPSTNAFSASAPVGTSVLPSKSLRFRSSASAYLSRTPAVAGNQKTWTWSGWVKRGTLGVYAALFAQGTGSTASGYGFLRFDSNDTLSFTASADGNTASIAWSSTAVYRDPAAWYHVVAVLDTTQATSSNRFKLYVNGVLQSGAFSGNAAQNADIQLNRAAAHQIGVTYAGSFANYFDGEMAEVNFVDGLALDPTIFGALSAYNQWLPISYSGYQGVNGFYLPFSNTTSTSTLVSDSSGNANNWTPNNISLTAGSTYDSLTDVPTLTSVTAANYAVLNPLTGAGPLSNGNLSMTGAGGASWATRVATIAVTSGKWYFEITPTSGSVSNGIMFGLTQDATLTGMLGTAATGYSYYGYDGKKYNNATGVAYGASVADNDVVGVAFDATAGSITFYKNNVSQGVAFSSMGSGTWFLGVSIYGTSAGAASINFGQQPFVYTPPTGFLALNTFNI